MAEKEVKLKIGVDTTKGEATIINMRNLTEKEFMKMSDSAKKTQ